MWVVQLKRPNISMSTIIVNYSFRIGQHGTRTESDNTAQGQNRTTRHKDRIGQHGTRTESDNTAQGQKRATRHKDRIGQHGTKTESDNTAQGQNRTTRHKDKRCCCYYKFNILVPTQYHYCAAQKHYRAVIQISQLRAHFYEISLAPKVT